MLLQSFFCLFVCLLNITLFAIGVVVVSHKSFELLYTFCRSQFDLSFWCRNTGAFFSACPFITVTKKIVPVI